MYAIFDTLEAYEAKHNEINIALGFPTGYSPTYANISPCRTKDGMYAMQILVCAEHLFAGCDIVESVEYEEIV